MIQSLQVPTATLIDQNGKAIDNVKLVMVCVCGGRGGGERVDALLHDWPFSWC